MDPDILIPLAGMVTAIILGLPIIRTVTRLMERKAMGQTGNAELEALRAEVQELRDATDSAHELHDRVLELEERADFTDRLLTQGNPRNRVPEERGQT